jgi:hypothetical protein
MQILFGCDEPFKKNVKANKASRDAKNTKYDKMKNTTFETGIDKLEKG